MKTLYLTLFSAFVLGLTSQAQITLLATWHEPQPGNADGTRSYDSTTAIPKATGASQTWDFSSLTMGTSSMMTNYVTPSTVPTASVTFPAATVVGDEGNNNYTFYKTSSSQWEYLGDMMGVNTTTLSDSKILMKWPTAFGGTYTDSYAGSSLGMAVTGTLSSNATGHGPVTLPGGTTYTNCLQLSITDVAEFVDATDSTNNFTLSSKVYTYYYDQQRFPIITIAYTDWTDADTTTKSVSIHVNHLLAVGLNDYNFNASYAIYPNPASGSFSVKLSNQHALPGHMEFYNMTGQMVKTVELGNSVTIEERVPIADLSSGVYMVKTTLGTQTSTRKLIVE